MLSLLKSRGFCLRTSLLLRWQVSIPRATPLVYDLDQDFIPISSPDNVGPLRGRFLANPLALARALHHESLQAQLGPVENAGAVEHAHAGHIFDHIENNVGRAGQS